MKISLTGVSVVALFLNLLVFNVAALRIFSPTKFYG